MDNQYDQRGLKIIFDHLYNPKGHEADSKKIVMELKKEVEEL